MLRNFYQITTSLLILTFSATLTADPALYRTVYSADYKGLPVSAKGIRELSRAEDGTFTLSSTATSFFSKISEVSRFKIEGQSIIPLEYQYHRTGIGKNRDAVLSFDWEKMKVLNDVQKKPWEMAIEYGTLDKLLYQLAMQEELRRAYEQGLPWPTLEYHVADGGRLKLYQFKVLGEEFVDTPVGKIKTIKAVRIHRKNRSTTFWLAPEYDFMLVRFEQTGKRGDGFELLLKEATFNGKKITKSR